MYITCTTLHTTNGDLTRALQLKEDGERIAKCKAAIAEVQADNARRAAAKPAPVAARPVPTATRAATDRFASHRAAHDRLRDAGMAPERLRTLFAGSVYRSEKRGLEYASVTGACNVKR